MSAKIPGPYWTDTAIFWQVYPLGFTGAPIRRPEKHHPPARLDHLIHWLDYAQELGTNGLLLGPIFTSQTHGYDTLNFFQIDPRLGNDDAFDRLITEAQTRGIRVVLDGVFNHVGINYPLFQQSLAGKESAAMFHMDYHSGQAQVFEGHDSLVEFDHSSPAVVDLVVDVMLYWLRRGIDGWRLDAAYAVEPEFWSHVLPRVRAEFPETYFVGEVIHGDYVAIIEASEMDSLTQYELWKSIWSSIHDRNFFELQWALQRHAAFQDIFRPMTFIGNHDVTRIASQVGDTGAAMAATLLFTLGGVPSIYYGDEQAFRGIKEERIGGDDEIRPELPTSPSLLSPQGTWLYRLYQQLISLRRNHPWLLDARAIVETVTNESIDYTVSVPASPDEALRVSLNLEEGFLSVRSSSGEILIEKRFGTALR